jgi:diacylglycerol kinase (ATP)
MFLEQPFLKNTIPSQGGTGQPALEGPAALRRPMTIGIISNPRSGGNRKEIDEIRKFVAANPGIHYGEGVTPAELNGVLEGFSARELDLLIVNGGDGTAQVVLTALYGRSIFLRPPVLALLRAGTASMLARDVGVSGKPSAGLAKVHAWSNGMGLNGQSIHGRAVLKIRREDHPEPVCGMFFGAGAIVRGIELCHHSINPKGRLGELMPGLIMARLLLALFTGNDKLVPATEMGIRLDEAPAQQNPYVMTLITTLERLFLGLRPFWGGEAAPLHFTAVKAKPSYWVRNLPFLLRGRRTRTASPENGFLSHNVRRITLDFRGRFTLDGELFEARAPLTVEAAGPAQFLRL